MTPIDAVLVGAGVRGQAAFGAFALRNPGLLRFVAVAEPDGERRCLFAENHSIPDEHRFGDWREIAGRERLAPVCIIATLDHDHLEPALAMMELGYDLLLEKPMAVSPRDCAVIVEEARRLGRMVQICHPLRFTSFYTKLNELLRGGAIGRPLSFSMRENVGYWHFAHSFVRGNWRRLDTSGPLILTKCCHDMDVACWLTGRRVASVASFGGRQHFLPQNAPEGAPERCTDGCPVEETCPYFAPALYLNESLEFPSNSFSPIPSLEERRRLLPVSPYGRCVYRCDNDTIDHQAVMIHFDDGTVVDFVVTANSRRNCRTIRVIGSEGEINGHFEESEIRVTRLGQGREENNREEVIETPPLPGGHMGGDEGALRHFIDCLRRGDRETLANSLGVALEGHLLAFAAEQARVSGTTVSMEDFRAREGRH